MQMGALPVIGESAAGALSWIGIGDAVISLQDSAEGGSSYYPFFLSPTACQDISGSRAYDIESNAVRAGFMRIESRRLPLLADLPRQHAKWLRTAAADVDKPDLNKCSGRTTGDGWPPRLAAYSAIICTNVHHTACAALLSACAVRRYASGREFDPPIAPANHQTGQAVRAVRVEPVRSLPQW